MTHKAKVREIHHGALIRAPTGEKFVLRDGLNPDAIVRKGVALEGPRAGDTFDIRADLEVELIQGMRSDLSNVPSAIPAPDEGFPKVNAGELRVGDRFCYSNDGVTYEVTEPETVKVVAVEDPDYKITFDPDCKVDLIQSTIRSSHFSTPGSRQKKKDKALRALKDRLEAAFGPLGLLDPEGAEDLLRDALDVLESVVK